MTSDNDDETEVPASVAPDEMAIGISTSSQSGFQPVPADFRGFGAQVAEEVQQLVRTADVTFKQIENAHGGDEGPSLRTVLKQKYGNQVCLCAP
jgi:hypothetical protein